MQLVSGPLAAVSNDRLRLGLAVRIASCAALLLLADAAGAQMTLTPYAMSRGFTLTDFVDGFSGSCYQGLTGGVNAVAYLANGSLVAVDINDCRLYSIPNHSDNQPGPSGVVQYYCNQYICTWYQPCVGTPWSLTQLDIGGTWHYYGTWLSGLHEFDPTTGWWIPPNAGAIGVETMQTNSCVPYPPAAPGPLHNHIFMGGTRSNDVPTIYDIDLAASTAAPFTTRAGAPSGLAFSLDGATLYATTGDTLYAFDVAADTVTWTALCPNLGGFGNWWTGVAVGVGNLSNYVYGLTGHGDLWEIEIPTGSNPIIVNLIATGGPGGQSLNADPWRPCIGGYPSLIIAQCDRMLRLDPPGGGWLGAPTSTLAPTVTAVSIGDRTAGAVRFSVAPNPTTGPARFAFTLAHTERIRLSVMDLQGREIATVTDGVYGAGVHEQSWNGVTRSGSAPTGMYFARLRVGDQVVTRPVIVRK